MSKFTSKDLMYAMGLAVGDVIENEYGLLVKIIETEKGEIKMERDDMPVKHKLIELVNKDFEIKNKTVRMTPEERSILKIYSDSKFNFIVRDHDGVWLFENDPKFEDDEDDDDKFYVSNGGDVAEIPIQSFKFIEMNQKYCIEELLKE